MFEGVREFVGCPTQLASQSGWPHVWHWLYYWCWYSSTWGKCSSKTWELLGMVSVVTFSTDNCVEWDVKL